MLRLEFRCISEQHRQSIAYRITASAAGTEHGFGIEQRQAGMTYRACKHAHCAVVDERFLHLVQGVKSVEQARACTASYHRSSASM